MTILRVPELSLVVLVGASGSGKSSFAAKHFRATETLSLERYRGMVSDDEADASATEAAVEALHFVARKRLERGRLTVIDAPHVTREARAPLVRLAREHHVGAIAIVLDLPAELCAERNEGRPGRGADAPVVRRQCAELRAGLRSIRKEGFREVFVLSSPEEIDAAVVKRTRPRVDRRDDRGPFDVIGDVHGCASELRALLAKLGYAADAGGVYRHPNGRKAVFLGDLVDRGPAIPEVLRVVMSMVRAGSALCVLGNHEAKLERKLDGRRVRLTHGLAQTVEQLEREPASFVAEVRAFLRSLPSHYVLDGGRLVVAHAGLPEHMHGRSSGRVREHCLYGDTSGEPDDLGLPVRRDWARAYRGEAAVVYGHTPVARARWVNNTLCIDTGCVFGGALTALRWPERELVRVPAERQYYVPVRPLGERERDVLDLGDVSGPRTIETRYDGPVAIREETAALALEAMSRFAIDPRWLVYLPPTMSPPEAPREGPLLEHPREAFAYYRERGVAEVVCEEKHEGSRAVVVVCKDEEAAYERFGERRLGAIHSRSGRPFYDAPLERALLERVRDAAEEAGLFDELRTGFLVLDATLRLPSAAPGGLSAEHHARIGAAGVAGLTAAADALERAMARGVDVGALLERTRARLDRVQRYVAVCDRHDRRPAGSVDDLALAPFHLIASEGAVHVDRDHVWHLATLARMARPGSIVRATRWRLVDLADPESERAATEWWLALTSAGGEGVVVKPRDWHVRYEQRLVQPALKCRGREHLRMVYGPEHTDDAILRRLRRRSLDGKRRLAIKEHALGLEAVARFVDGEPLHRVHECVLGVLALEREPIDPRL